MNLFPPCVQEYEKEMRKNKFCISYADLSAEGKMSFLKQFKRAASYAKMAQRGRASHNFTTSYRPSTLQYTPHTERMTHEWEHHKCSTPTTQENSANSFLNYLITR